MATDAGAYSLVPNLLRCASLSQECREVGAWHCIEGCIRQAIHGNIGTIHSVPQL
jgi:hypothetical protein